MRNALVAAGVTAVACSASAAAAGDFPGPDASAAALPGRADPAVLAALASADQDLYLEIVLNGSPQPGLTPVRKMAGRLHAAVSTLAALGIDRARLQSDGAGWVALDRLPGARVDYDPGRQRLELDVAPELLATTHVTDASMGQPARADTGAVLNYDAYLPVADTGTSLRTFLDGRVFGDWGVLSTTSIAAIGEDTDGFTRLETTLTRTDQTHMRTLRVGDVTSGALGWTRAVRMGGIQLQRRFAARPDLVTYPLPSFAGEAAVPSSVDLYVNQMHQFASQVPGGPFVIDTTPALIGAGEALIVVRDALGRESTLSVPLYVAPQMLAPGLSDYSAELGWLRKSYGVDSATYGAGPVASASGRYGWREWLTVEAHSEGADGLGAVGAGAQVRLGRLGVLSTAVAASVGEGPGGQWMLGYQYIDARLSVAVETRRASMGFRDLAGLDGSGVERRADRVLVSLPDERWGTWSFGYLRSRRDGPDADCDMHAVSNDTGCRWHTQNSRIATLGWSRTLPWRMSLFGNLVRDLDRSDGTRVHVGVAFAFGDRGHGNLDAGRSEGENDVGASIRHRADYDGGWQWGIDARRRGAVDALRAHGGYLGRYGEVETGIESYREDSFAHVGARGALAWLDGAVFAGRQIHDAFAVVTTDGIADVPVLHENRPLGRTGRSGHLLVPNLSAWGDNRIGVDPLGVPLDRALPVSVTVVVPKEQSGVVVRFTADRYDGAVVRLVDSTGAVLPPGTGAWLASDPARRFIVGYDGVVFISGLPHSDATLLAQTGTGQCSADLPARTESAAIPDLGEVACR